MLGPSDSIPAIANYAQEVRGRNGIRRMRGNRFSTRVMRDSLRWETGVSATAQVSAKVRRQPGARGSAGFDTFSNCILETRLAIYTPNHLSGDGNPNLVAVRPPHLRAHD